MTQAGEALGIAVASLAMILDIELYVIGGSVAKSGDLLLGPARQIVPDYAFESVASQVRIVPAALGDDGPILGCGWLARQT
jgi:glucokinase